MKRTVSFFSWLPSKTTLLFLVVFFCTSAKTFSQCFTYTVVACIDGRSLLHIEGNQLWWEHLNHDPPGTHSGCPGPVTVNGANWIPWTSTYTLPNSTTGCSLVANVLVCPDICVIIQAPTAANNWEAIYDFNDNGPSGPHMFTIELQYFCPTPDAGTDVSICSGQSTNLNASGGVGYDWSPSTGLSCTNCVNPVASPTTTTTYTATVTDVNGCSDTDDVTVTVLNNPVAAFSNALPCNGSPIQFTDNSTGNPTSWQWDFGDGSPPSNGQNPTHTYTQTGPFTVTLTATAGGCSSTTTGNITIPPPINTSITGTDPLCNSGTDGTADLTVNGGTPPYSFVWSSGSTQEDPTNLTFGTTTVTITDANNCTATESIVLADPDTFFISAYSTFVSSQGACDGGGVVTQAGGTPPYTYSWDNGETTQTVTTLCEGQHTITVTDANGCTATRIIVVSAPACLTDVDFYTWQQAGIPINGNWIVQNGGAQVRQVINGEPTFFVTPSDYINVRMKGQMRTTDSDDDFMGVVFGFKSPLTASNDFDMWLFDWKQGNQGAGLEGFTLNHVVGTITNYGSTFWDHNTTPEFTVVATDFGNNGWNQNVDYEVEVTYTIGRAIIMVDGDTIFDVYDCFEPGRFGFYNYSQRNVYYSDFTYELFTDFTIVEQEICTGDSAHITFLETCGGFNNFEQFDELQWDYGDGESEVFDNVDLSNVNPVHQYTTPGTYDIRLIALDSLGCRDTVIHSLTVLENPTADFTFADQCLQDNTQFTDASTQGDNLLTGWNWDFGDNTTDVQQNPTHQFGNSGDQNVQLIVQDAFGCVDTSEQVVEIHVLPQADFTPIDDCYSSNYPFQDQSVITNGTVDNWEWYFGDLTTSTSQNPTHTYAIFGSYDVELIAVSDQGCGDTILQTIILHDNPIAGFVLPQICQLQPFSLQDTSSIQEGTIAAWDYAFGDAVNGTSSVQNPTYMYQDAGIFDLVLTVTSNFNCTGTITVPTLVDPKPVADFATQNECLNDVMDFQDLSSVASGSVVTWEWDFGDLNTDIVQSPSHLFTTFGNFTVELMVETDNGCRDTTSQQVEIYQLPVAAFNYSDVCLLDSANFTDQSTTNSGVVDSWNWDLGDNSTENVQGPISHLYDPPNTYTVELIVQTDVGCWDTVEQDIIIYPMPETDFVADSVCFGQPTNFTDQSSILSGIISTYDWNFGSGATSNLQNPTNIFPQTSYTPVTLLLTSDFGCKDTITKDIRVYVLPEPDFSFIDTCFEDQVDFINLSQIPEGTNDIYDWDFADATTSQLTDPTHWFPAEGFYPTQLIATSNFGCQDSITRTVEIYPLPQLAFTPFPPEGCQPLEVLFNNESSITPGYFISDYYWEFGNGLNSIEQEPQITYVDSGYYTVMLIGTTTKGCDDTLIRVDVINAWPRPVAGFQTDKDRYAMYFPKVRFEDLSFGATEWHYDFDDGGQSTDQNPVYEYSAAGTYEVVQTVVNDYGCDDVTSVRVIVDPAITFYIPNTFTPNDDGHNETFAGYGEGIEEYELWIFDRWGEQLFYSAEMDGEWDGTYLGKAVESGVYVYKFGIVDVNQEFHQYTGSVHLFR